MSKPSTYYKATRPDGTDFRTGTILYEVGKRVRPHPTDAAPEICGAGFLHAADVPAETLVGGDWPCRLFEVAGTPAAGFNEEHRHKGGFRQLIVGKELPAHLALGPNGKLVAGVIERTRALTLYEARELAWAAAWGATRAATWAAARGAAWAAAWGAARGAAMGAAWGATRAAAWGAARDAAMGAAWGATRAAAWGAARDAALAVLVRDLISAEHFDVLYGPWAKVIDAKDDKS